MKEFRESQKQELRLLKQEIDLMPKDKRKSIFKERKEKLEKDHEEKVSRTIISGALANVTVTAKFSPF